MLIEVNHFMEEIPYLALPRGRQLSNIENETLQANNRSSNKTRLVKVVPRRKSASNLLPL